MAVVICSVLMLLIPIVASVLMPPELTAMDSEVGSPALRLAFEVELAALAAWILIKLTGAVVFINWLMPAVQNARTLNSSNRLPPDFTAKSCWVIPIWNLFAPFLLMRHLSRAVPVENQRKLNNQVYLWSAFWFLQTQPIDFAIIFLAPAGLDTTMVVSVPFVLYGVAGFYLIKIMDTITLSQEKELAMQMDAEAPLVQADTVEEGQSFVIRYVESERMEKKKE